MPKFNPNRTQVCFLLLKLLLFCLAANSVGAAETASIGKVIALRGQASASLDGDAERTLQLGDEISTAELIRTGTRCRMQIMFADSSIVSLGPESEFVVNDYAWDQQSGQGKMHSQVNEGVFRILGGSITKTSPQNFTTETPGATIGIRGSMYAGQVRDGGLQVVFQGGKGIFVRNDLGSVEISIPGYGTKVTGSGQAPPPPYQLPPAELQQLDPLAATPAEQQATDAAAAESLGVASDSAASTTPAAEELGPQVAALPTTAVPVSIEPPAQMVTADQISSSGPTPSLPSSGLSRYSGTLRGTLVNIGSGAVEALAETFNLGVNWHNGKLFGAIIPAGSNKSVGFFIGNLSGTGLNISHFFGNDIVAPDMGPILAINGSSSASGQFYGQQADSVAFAAAGNTISIQNQLAEETWQFSAAGLRNSATGPSSTGIVTWKGFAVGVGEDMGAIDVQRRLFHNQDANDFTLSINRDSGNINGSLSAVDVASATTINGLQIGGSNGSAYLSDDILAALIGGGNPITNGGSGPLKNYGNYLLTAEKGNQLASYVSWGAWEIAYTDPGNGGQYHVHMPGAYWVAGEMTTPADFATLNFAATYNCRAEGVYVPSSGPFAPLPTGSATLNVNFGTGTFTSGSINFAAGNGAPAVNLGIDPSSIASTGFTAPISTPNSGSVHGAFYGPAAASAAGNFEAQLGADRVIGVFGGDR